MKRILIIEDDPLIADVYSQQLRAEGFAVDVAADGKAGLEIFNGHRADLVILDLMLPKIDGVEVLKTIRAQAGLREVPIIVFTNAYLDGMVQAAWEAGASQVLTKTAYTPRQVVQIVKIALDPGLRVTPGSAAVPVDPTPAIDLRARKEFLELAPKAITGLRSALDDLANDPKNPSQLQELRAKIRPLVTTAGMTGLPPVARMAEALEGLLKVLGEKNGSVTLSVLLTITQAIDTLEYLFDNAEAVARPDPARARILVVDDDEFVRRAVSSALKKVNLKATCVDNPASAILKQGEKNFDLIFLDIEMPVADGYGLCSILRGTQMHRETPIIFLSMHTDDEHRKESFVRGANDFINKPFLSMELAVKALSFVMRGSWNNSESVQSAARDFRSRDESDMFPRSNAIALEGGHHLRQ